MKKGVDYIGATCVFYCHDGKGNLLLHKRSENCRDEQGRWDPGGGTMEFGEDFEETVRREVREEYCTIVKNLKMVDVRSVRRKNGKERTHWIAIFFVVEVDREKVKNGDPDKIDELGWFTRKTLPHPLHSQFDIRLIKNIINR